jgi:hypothetical protein
MEYSFSDIEAFASRFYNGRQLLITPYGYNLTFLALAQNTTQSQTINIAANADFIALSFAHRAQIGAAQTISGVTAPFVRMLVSDSGSNEQFSNVAVDLQNYSTGPNFANNLAYPRVVAGRSTLTVQVTNYAPVAETYTSLDIYIEGVLVRAYQK